MDAGGVSLHLGYTNDPLEAREVSGLSCRFEAGVGLHLPSRCKGGTFERFVGRNIGQEE